MNFIYLFAFRDLFPLLLLMIVKIILAGRDQKRV